MFLTSVLAVASAILALGPGTATSNAAAPSGDYFGMNVQFLFLGLPEQQWGTHLDVLAATGVTSARYDALWEIAEPQPPAGGRHTYRWDHFDQVAAALASRGVRWYPIISFSASWAASVPGNMKSPPRDLGDYSAYAGALAARYGPDGQFWRERPDLAQLPVVEWEIWNQPNVSSFWAPQPNPERYGELYAAARAAIRRVDPRAKVLVGGLGDAPWFLPRMFAHRPDLRGQVDGVAIHPYGADPDASIGLVVQYRRQLDELGEVNTPLAVTEMGWPTAGSGGLPAVPEPRRAEYVAEVANRVTRSDCGVDRFTPYAWITDVRDSGSQERWYGFVERDAAPTPTSLAYAGVIRDVRGQGDAFQRDELCGRIPVLAVEATQSSRSTRARPRSCYQALVTLGSQPLAQAAVRFKYPGRTRTGRRRAWVSRRTDESGRASACFTGTTTRRRTRGKVRVVASRGDLARTAGTSVDVPHR